MSLDLGGAGLSRFGVEVAGHNLRLTTNGDQDKSIADDKEQEQSDVVADEVGDTEDRFGELALIELEAVTDAVNNGTCRKRHAACFIHIQLNHVLSDSQRIYAVGVKDYWI